MGLEVMRMKKENEMVKENNSEIYLQMFTEYPDIVSPVEMCQMLNISLKTAYRLLTTKEIASIRIGSHYKIPKINIIKFLQK